MDDDTPLPLVPPPTLAKKAEQALAISFCLSFGALAVGGTAFLLLGPMNLGWGWGGRIAAMIVWLGSVGFVPIAAWREMRAEYGWTGSLDGNRLEIRRGGDATVLDLRTLTAVRWPPMPHGALTLTGPGGTVRIAPKTLEPAMRLAFVRRLRTTVVEEVQTGWPRYCRAAALEMVRCELPTRPLRPGERVIAEHFSAGSTLFCILVGEAGGWWAWWLTAQPAYLIVGPATGLLVPTLRWSMNRTSRPIILPPPDETTEQRNARAVAEWEAWRRDREAVAARTGRLRYSNP